MNHTKPYANVAYKISYNIYKILKQVKQHHLQFGLPLTFEKLPASITNKYSNELLNSIPETFLEKLSSLNNLKLVKAFFRKHISYDIKAKTF